MPTTNAGASECVILPIGQGLAYEHETSIVCHHDPMFLLSMVRRRFSDDTISLFSMFATGGDVEMQVRCSLRSTRLIPSTENLSANTTNSPAFHCQLSAASQELSFYVAKLHTPKRLKIGSPGFHLSVVQIAE
jgi:hypothetical protein